jgi:ATP/ADP translocase/CRP-like cAMP-binding protein/HEAT repeat protein
MPLLDKVVTLRRGEGPTALLMFTYSFLAMMSYNIVKPVTQSKFIDGLGALYVPFADLGAGIIIGILMQAYLQGTGRLPRRSIIPVTLAGLSGVLVVFWVLFQTGSEWVAVSLYVFGRLFGILVISQFWTLANEIYDARQARRVFGFIGGGSSLGGMLGGVTTSLTASTVGATNLLLVGAAVLLGCMAIAATIIRRQPDLTGGAAVEVEKGVGAREAVRLLQSSRHLQLIALVIGFAAIASVVISQQLYMAAEAAKTTESDLTSFLGSITAYLSGVSFFVQVFLTSRIHRSFGLTFALLLLPVSLSGAAVVILLSGALWAAGGARVLDTALRYSIDKTTREVLFLPLPSELKQRAKPFIDVTVDRLGKAAGSLVLIPLIWPELLGLDWVTLSFASLGLTAVWIGFALVARREYLRSFRRSLDTRQMMPDAVRLDVADPATIEALVEGLASPDETAVLYAIEMLETLDKRHLITPLLLHHGSPAVRARALAALEAAGRARAQPWMPMIEGMLKDQDAGVRASAVRTLAALEGQEASTLLHRFLEEDDQPRVVVTAAAELADSDRRADVEAAEAAFARLVDDTRAAAAEGRRDAAAALARVRNAAFRPLLIQLIHDADVTVAAEAMASVGKLPQRDALFLPALVSRLGHRLLKAAARETIVSYGDEAVGFLALTLSDPNEQLWVRRHVPATLARIPTQQAMDALVAAADAPDGFLRFKIVSAIETLRRDHPALAFPMEAAERMIVRETARYYTYLTLRDNLVRHDPAAERSLLVTALSDKLARTLDRIFRLLGLVHSWKDIAAARWALGRGDARGRAGALEYLDNTLGGVIRKRVMPILDEAPMAERVRHANSVLKSRPRDVPDTLAQLIHEDDRVVASAAVHFAGAHGLQQALRDDLDYVAAHRADDACLQGAVSWVLAGSGPATDGAGPLPDVELADRLRAIPLFGFVSVDELFRVAGAARHVRYEAGADLYQPGEPATDVLFLLDGRAELLREGADPAVVDAPAALNVTDVLEGRASSHAVRAVRPIIGLTLDAGDFLTMLADNTLAAQGLLHMLMGPPRVPDVYTRRVSAPAAARDRGPLDPVEKATLLRHTPLFAGATVEQLKDLVALTREVSLPAGTVIFQPGNPAAIYHVLAGEIRVEEDGAGPTGVGAGGSIGVVGSLTRRPMACRATATRDSRVLYIDPDDLFDVLSNHSDLLQGVFSGVLSGTGSRRDRRSEV